jgi:hypothetical protein
MRRTGMLLAIVTAFAAGAAAENTTKTAGPLPETAFTPLVPQLGAKGPQYQVVFGDLSKKKAPIGLLLKIPAGFTPGPHIHSSDYTGVAIAGELLDTPVGGLDKGERITAGRRWFEPAKNPHDNLCASKVDCLEFVYFPNGFDTLPVK